MKIWVAVGIPIEHAALSNANAQVALRAYAFSNDMTLNDLANKMSTRQLEPGTLLSA